MIEYNTQAIIELGIKIPEKWIKLKYTTHALERINQREKGSLICYPSQLNISRKNVISCECEVGTRKPKKIKYQVEFKKGEYMILVLLPQEKWTVVTVYFKKYGRK